MTGINKSGNIVLRLHPLLRILISIVFSLAAYFLFRNAELSWMIMSLILWNIFALTYNLQSWIIFFTCTTTQLRKRASKADGSRLYVFLLILIASLASMLNVLLLFISKDSAETAKIIYLPVVIGGMLLSWMMVHTTFCFHYAHKYYNDDILDPTKHAEGLIFPHEKKPDYLDFAYFSFVIGMTFQVSDVQITSRLIRRLVLIHGLLAFALSVFVVAMTINLIAGLVH